MHRLLGAVHSSDRPPPFVHLSDGAAADRVGLIELLRRRQVSALPFAALRYQLFVFDDICRRHRELKNIMIEITCVH